MTHYLIILSFFDFPPSGKKITKPRLRRICLFEQWVWELLLTFVCLEQDENYYFRNALFLQEHPKGNISYMRQKVHVILCSFKMSRTETKNDIIGWQGLFLAANVNFRYPFMYLCED